MTTAASTDYLIVIDVIRSHRLPGIDAMTGFAQITGIYVGRCLASSASTIMTGNTRFTGQAMVECRHQPVGCYVATITFQCSWDMGTGIFTGGDYPIVATTAGSVDLRVINGRCRDPGRCFMAGLAQVSCINMCS